MLKLGAARVPARLEEVHRVVDASNLDGTETKDRVERHEVAECTLEVQPRGRLRPGRRPGGDRAGS